MRNNKVWSIPDERKTKKIPTETIPLRSLRPSPRGSLWAATLSLFFWGLGQLYNKQYRKGILFFLFMVLGASIFYFILNRWDQLPWANLVIFSSLTGLSLLAILVWLYQILEAYRVANRKQSGGFPGIDNAFLAATASFLIPGWGQLANGQPKKAVFFMFFHFLRCWLVGLIWLTPFVWQRLTEGPERVFFEKFLLGTALAIPLIVFCWLLSISDAIKIAQHPGKREPLIKRIKYAWNRWRIKLPKVKVKKSRKRRIFLLVLLLLSLAAAYLSSIYFPTQQFYLSKMIKLEQELTRAGFVIIPEYLREISAIFPLITLL
jgi:TM2 domain-containing membrane protein YozV